MATWTPIATLFNLILTDKAVKASNHRAIADNLDALAQGPSTGAPNVWGAHSPFIDVFENLAEDDVIGGFDKITLDGVDFPVWYWELFFVAMENNISTAPNGRALRLTLSKDGGGSLGTIESGFIYYNGDDPVDVVFKIFNFGETGSRRNLFHTYGHTTGTGGPSDGGSSGRAYAGSADWNEVTLTHNGGGLITAGTLVRRAHLYPDYHLP